MSLAPFKRHRYLAMIVPCLLLVWLMVPSTAFAASTAHKSSHVAKRASVTVMNFQTQCPTQTTILAFGAGETVSGTATLTTSDTTIDPTTGVLGETKQEKLILSATNNAFTMSFNQFALNVPGPPQNFQFTATSAGQLQGCFQLNLKDDDGDLSGGMIDHSASVTATVVEPAPVFNNPPANQTKTAGANDMATFTFATPVTANEPGELAEPISVTCTVSSPVTLPLGVHPESCTATDTTDNAANPVKTNFTLTVSDEATVLRNPGNQTVVADATDTALLSYPTVTATEQPSGESDGITPVCTANNGATSANGFLSSGTFKLGVTTVTCNAKDTVDGTTPPGINAIPTQFTMTVADQPVTLTVPASPIIVNATSPAGALVTYATVTATEDAEVETISITCTANNGATSSNGFISSGQFPINPVGQFTTVTCTATDTADGTNPPGSVTKFFQVHVAGAVEQLNNLCNQFPTLTFGDEGTFCTQLHMVIAELQSGQTNQACFALTIITAEVGITHNQAILTALARIQNVIGCPSNASFDQF